MASRQAGFYPQKRETSNEDIARSQERLFCREDVLHQLRETFYPRLRHGQGNLQPVRSVVQALTGMSGVGKTAIASAYASQAVADGLYRNGVYWVNADNVVTLESSLRDLAVQLGIGAATSSTTRAPLCDIVSGLKNGIKNFTNSLIIMDNVDRWIDSFDCTTESSLLMCILPTVRSALHLLILSKCAVFPPSINRLIARKIHVLPLSLSDSAWLLATLSGRLKKGRELMQRSVCAMTNLHALTEQLQQLLKGHGLYEQFSRRRLYLEIESLLWLAGGEGLGGLPLLIVIAGSRLAESGSTFTLYKKILQQSLNPVGNPEKHANSLKLFSLSVGLSFHRLSQAAQDMLSISCYLHPDSIPFKLFTSINQVEHLPPSIQKVLFQGDRQSFSAKSKEMLIERNLCHLVCELQKLSLASFCENSNTCQRNRYGSSSKTFSCHVQFCMRGFKMHRLVKNCLLSDILPSRSEKTCVNLLSAAIKLLNVLCQETAKSSSCLSLLPHLMSITPKTIFKMEHYPSLPQEKTLHYPYFSFLYHTIEQELKQFSIDTRGNWAVLLVNAANLLQLKNFLDTSNLYSELLLQSYTIVMTLNCRDYWPCNQDSEGSLFEWLSSRVHSNWILRREIDRQFWCRIGNLFTQLPRSLRLQCLALFTHYSLARSQRYCEIGAAGVPSWTLEFINNPALYFSDMLFPSKCDFLESQHPKEAFNLLREILAHFEHVLMTFLARWPNEANIDAPYKKGYRRQRLENLTERVISVYIKLMQSCVETATHALGDFNSLAERSPDILRTYSRKCELNITRKLVLFRQVMTEQYGTSILSLIVFGLLSVFVLIDVSEGCPTQALVTTQRMSCIACQMNQWCEIISRTVCCIVQTVSIEADSSVEGITDDTYLD